MRSVIPVASTDALKALLATRNFFMADLFRFAIPGTSLRYTAAESDITWNNFTYTALPIQRSNMGWKTGIEVSTAEMLVYPRSSDLIGSYSWMQAVRFGVLDPATVKIFRVFWSPSSPTIVGGVELFDGLVAGITAGQSTGVRIDVNSDMERLNVMIPRNIYEPGCIHTLYDSGCKLDTDDWTTAKTVGAGATLRTVPVPGTGTVNGYYNQGVLTMDSGLIRRTVKKWTGGVATLITPLHAVPAAGTDVSLIAGCNKTQSMCETKFDNVSNHRAFPFIPAPESSLSV